MNAAFRSRIRIAVVVTRELAAPAGRPGILSNIIRVLQRNNDVQVFRLRNVMELRGVSDIAGAALAWLWGLIRGRPIPLQCLLYASPRACARLTAQIRDGAFDAVYLDTVRCQILLRFLRRTMLRMHVVTDFDDLMSRRMGHLSRSGQPLLPGHVAPALPGWIRSWMEGPLSRLITVYEAAALKSSESEVVAGSNATVLLSKVERQLLLSRLTEEHQALIHAIPPALEVMANPWMLSRSLRFVFIGSDRLVQNRRAIDYLLKKWRTLKPATTLHIYGRHIRPMTQVPGVHWHGFVDDLSEIYAPGTISLVPALVSGGIKTKVAEAWAWGCPVLGNDSAFEGLAISNYPLARPETQWDALISDPAAHGELWVHAARLGHEFVRRNLSFDAFEHAWENVMQPVPPGVYPAPQCADATVDLSCAE